MGYELRLCSDGFGLEVGEGCQYEEAEPRMIELILRRVVQLKDMYGRGRSSRFAISCPAISVISGDVICHFGEPYLDIFLSGDQSVLQFYLFADADRYEAYSGGYRIEEIVAQTSIYWGTPNSPAIWAVHQLPSGNEGLSSETRVCLWSGSGGDDINSMRVVTNLSVENWKLLLEVIR